MKRTITLLAVAAILATGAAPLAPDTLPPSCRRDRGARVGGAAPLPTYPVGPAEPNPMFYAGREYQGAKGPVYPYPLLDRLRDRREDRAYRALWLENEYVKISVLPEIGGRIFTAQDKTNGYDFFYRQHVIKPALIGMLGAWISGGVEWNVLPPPPGHLLHARAVGDHRERRRQPHRSGWERPSGARGCAGWSASPSGPGASYVEASVRMTNRTPLPHSMLYFSNPAVHANESYQVLFPPDVDWATFHAKTDFAPWPLARRALPADTTSPRAPTSAGGRTTPTRSPSSSTDSEMRLPRRLRPRPRAGVVHVADRDTVPGKKFWTWGNGPDGRDVGPDPHRRGRPLHRADGRRLLRQPARLLLDPAGRDAHRRPLLVPGARAGRRQGGQPEGALNLEVRDGRPGSRPTPHPRPRRAGAPPAGERVVLEDDRHHRPRRALRAGGRAARRHRRGGPPPRRPLGRRGRSSSRTRAAPGRRRPSRSGTSRPRLPAEMKTRRGARTSPACASSSSTTPTSSPRPTTARRCRRDPGLRAHEHLALGVLALRRGPFEEAEKHLAAAVARLTANHTRARRRPGAVRATASPSRRSARADAAREAFAAAGVGPGVHRGRRPRAGPPRGGPGEPVRRPRAPRPRAVSADPRAPPPSACRPPCCATRGGRRRRLRAGVSPRSPSTRSIPSPRASGRLGREGGSATRRGPGHRRRRGGRPARRSTRTPTPSRRRTTTRAPASSTTRSPCSPPACRERRREGRPDGGLHPRLAPRAEGRRDAAAAVVPARPRAPPRLLLPLPPRGASPSSSTRSPWTRSDPRAPYYLGNLLYDLQPERAIAEWEKARALDPGFARVHRNLAFAYARARGDLADGRGQPGEGGRDREARAAPLLRARPATSPGRGRRSTARLRGSRRAPRRWRAATSPAAGSRASSSSTGQPDDAARDPRGRRFHVWEGESGHPLGLRGGAASSGAGVCWRRATRRRRSRSSGRRSPSRQHRGGPTAWRAPPRRAPPRGPRPRGARAAGGGRGGLPLVRGGARSVALGPLLDRAARCRSWDEERRAGPSSSPWPEPPPRRWTRAFPSSGG